MRVHHLDCGTMCPASARLVKGRGGWLEPARMVCHCLLVEGSDGDGLVLVDTGLGTSDIDDPRRRLSGMFLRAARPRLDRTQTALAQLERLGFRRVRVRVVGDDIALVPLIGHTRGHCAVAVKGEQGWLLHAGDAYFFHAEVDPVRPRSTPGLSLFQRFVAMDDEARRNNQVRLRNLVRDHGDTVRVFSAHDPTELDAMASNQPTPRQTPRNAGPRPVSPP